jgi:pyruvate dehydrogenase E2 component (dihydrolipoamide acetyltransferase)
MAVEIRMPRLSQTTDEVKLLNWLVSEGDRVNKGDPLCEVETDKVTMSVESYESGTVLKLTAEPDSVVDAGTLIAVLGEAAEKSKYEKEPAGKPRIQRRSPSGSQTRKKNGGSASAASPTPGRPGVDGVYATRLVRNIAKKRNIDLSGVKGTGPRGLITKSDLEQQDAGGGNEQVSAGLAADAAPRGVGGEVSVREIPLTTHQSALGRSLSMSKREAPHYYLKTTIAADRMVEYRNLNPTADGSKLSVDSFFIFAVGRALRELPELNGYYKEGKRFLHSDVHINVAIAQNDKLFAPVVRNADLMSIEEIDRAVRTLSAKVKEGVLEPSDIAVGSFTVSNLGMYPVDEFYAIINPPQPGILAVGRMRKTLLVDSAESMQIGTTCSVTASFDHRVVNGAQGAQFLQYVKKTLEEI